MGRLFYPIIIYLMIISGSAVQVHAVTPEADKGLNGLIEEALANNQEIAALKESITSVEKMAGFQGSLSDPRLGVSFSNLPVDDLNFQTDPMSQKQIFIAQKFPWPGKLDLKSQTYSLEGKRLAQILTKRELMLASEITDVYYSIGYTSESLELNETLAALFENIINSATSKYSSGRGLQQDIFQAEVELSKLANEKIILLKQYKTLQNKLHSLLNRNTFREITPPNVPPFFDFNPESEKLKQRLVERNPQLQSLMLEIEKNKSETNLAKKDYYPDIDVKFTYGQRDEDRTGRSLDDLVSLSATVNLPVWKSKRQDSNVSAKKATEHASIKKYEDLKLRLPYMADILVTEIINSGISYRLYRERLIPQSRRWANSALSDYEVGKIEFNTMIKARIQPLRFELKAKQYLFEMHKKRAELEELTGGATVN